MQTDQSLPTCDYLVKSWDKLATELLKNDKRNSSIDQTDCEANETEQEIAKDIYKLLFFFLGRFFVDNLKVFAQFHGLIASKLHKCKWQSDRYAC